MKIHKPETITTKEKLAILEDIGLNHIEQEGDYYLTAGGGIGNLWVAREIEERWITEAPEALERVYRKLKTLAESVLRSKKRLTRLSKGV